MAGFMVVKEMIFMPKQLHVMKGVAFKKSVHKIKSGGQEIDAK